MDKLPIKIKSNIIDKITEPIIKLNSVIHQAFGSKGNSLEKAFDIILNQKVDEIEKRGLKIFLNNIGNKQKNIESIVSKSIKYLPPKTVKSGKLPDDEWVLDFFDLCQNCSNDQVQEIWAKLLADKVDNPDAHSRRLMHTIKLLDVKEAFTFNNLSKCFCEISLGSKGNEFDEFGNNFGTIWSVGETVIIEDNSYDFGIDYDTCLNLQEIGLISNKEYFEDDDIVRKVSFIENGETQSYYLNKARLSIFEFTKIGFELFEIANHHLNPEYKKEILEHLKGNIN